MREDVIDEIEKYLDGDMAELPFATKEKSAVPWIIRQAETATWGI